MSEPHPTSPTTNNTPSRTRITSPQARTRYPSLRTPASACNLLDPDRGPKCWIVESSPISRRICHASCQPLAVPVRPLRAWRPCRWSRVERLVALLLRSSLLAQDPNQPPRVSLSGVPYLASPLAHGFSGALRGL